MNGKSAVKAARADLIADVDEHDVAGGVEGQDIGADPLSRGVGIGGERGDVSVGGSYHDPDAAVGQGLDDGRIRAIKPDLSDCGRPEKFGGGLRWREVVGHLPIVDPNERLRSCAADSRC